MNVPEFPDVIPAHTAVTVHDYTYTVVVWGVMSYRQYFVSREDDMVARLLRRGWRRLGYLGASYGLQAIRLAEAGPVFAFEPIPCIFEALRLNIALNHSRVVPLPLGLSNEDEFREIMHRGHTGPTPSIHAVDAEATCVDSAHLVRLDSDVMSLFDTVVMDVEGHEYEIFFEGPAVPCGINAIFLELHKDYSGQNRETRLVENLTSQGFRSELIGRRNTEEHWCFERGT